jgi:hypothetical protein
MCKCICICMCMCTCTCICICICICMCICICIYACKYVHVYKHGAQNIYIYNTIYIIYICTYVCMTLLHHRYLLSKQKILGNRLKTGSFAPSYGFTTSKGCSTRWGPALFRRYVGDTTFITRGRNGMLIFSITYDFLNIDGI